MILDKFRLDDKVAIVTGGGTGLGKAICQELARAGADVVVAARRPGPIEETAAEVRQKGRRALALSTDITDSSQVNRLVEETLDAFGRIDILVNNAGIARGWTPKPIWEMTDDEWYWSLDTNITGSFYCSRAVARHMVERKQGCIINLSSGSGLRGIRDNFAYAASKGGVIQLTKSLALSLAGAGIRVNCIVPGYYPTGAPTHADEARWTADSRARFNPTGRVGRTEEIGRLAVFLASEASSYLTGALFILDGGALAAGYAPTGYALNIALP